MRERPTARPNLPTVPNNPLHSTPSPPYPAQTLHLPGRYTTLSFDELHALVHSPHYLFARKFDAGCDGLEPLREMHRGAARAVSGV